MCLAFVLVFALNHLLDFWQKMAVAIFFLQLAYFLIIVGAVGATLEWLWRVVT